jgi:purine nucleosidase
MIRIISRIFGVFLCMILLTHMSVHAKTNVIFDHDGGVDDFSALMVILGAKNFELRAVTIQPADCYKDPTVEATQKYLDFLGAKNVKIAASNEEGVHPFPDAWRADSLAIQRLIPKQGSIVSTNRIESQSAPSLLAELLSGKEKYTLILTGPLYNLAAALKINPTIAKNIERAYIMGGAVRVKGNIDDAPEAGEWNFYNHPQAAYEVLRASIPITLVGLDATNAVRVKDPLTSGSKSLIQLLKENTSSRTSQLAYQTWHVAQETIDSGIYYFWDTLTAAAAIEPKILRTTPMKIKVLTRAPFEGKTIETQDVDGRLIDVAVGVNKSLFQSTVLKALR